MIRPERFLAQVPLADVRRGVARVMEPAREIGLLQIQFHLPVGDSKLRKRTLMTGNPVCEMQGRRIAARQNRRPRRRAHLAHRIRPIEAHAFPPEPIDIRRVIQFAAE